jgi:tetratricopeptide (TPR) repeat protein
VPLAEEQVSWSVDQWLAQARHLMNDPLLGLLRGENTPALGGASLSDQAANLSEDKPPVRLAALGQQLYNALFQGTIRDSWMTAMGIAHHRRELLRLRLGLKDDRLPYLPWEALYAGDRPLATGTDVVFSRYQSAFSQHLSLPTPRIAALQPNQPLKILMVIAAPTDQEVLELKQEATYLVEELKSPLKNGSTEPLLAIEHDPGLRLARQQGLPEIDLTILEQPGRERLTQALEQGQFDVFHYAGHSNLGQAGGNLYLVNDRTGLTEELSGDDLAGLLVNNGIRLAVFNSCRGSYAPTADLSKISESGNLAEAVIKRGIPAVLAMAERIPDEVALTLTRLFYRNLRKVYPIDLSLNRARQGLIAAYTSNQSSYWALPILYLHPEFDGYLHTATGETESAAPHRSDRHRFSGIDLPEIDGNQDYPAPLTSETLNSESELDTIPIDFLNENETPPEDLAQLIQDIELDDPSYKEDAAVVSDLIRQLSVEEGDEEPLLPASKAESLLPNQALDSGLGLYRELPENPQYKRSPILPTNNQLASNRPAPSSSQPASGGRQSYAEFHSVPRDPESLMRMVVACQQAIRANPQDAEAHYRLGRALFEQGKLAQAIKAYEQAIQLNPGLTEAYDRLKLAMDRREMTQAAAPAGGLTVQAAAAPVQPSVSPNPLAAKAKPLGLQPATLPTQPKSNAQKTGVFLLAILGLSGVIAAVLLNANWLQQRWQRHSPVPTSRVTPSPTPRASQPLTSQPINVKTADTAAVTAFASTHLRQGDLANAQPAIEALLDRGALPQAKAALDAAPTRLADNPVVNFLKGRFAWQSVQKGNKDYSIDDARRYWETATKQQKDSVPYLNALGFAYYASGEWDLANRAWSDALTLSQGKPINPQSQLEAGVANTGLALVAFKSAQDKPAEQKERLLNDAMQLRQKVLTDDPVNFQPEALGKDWRWNEPTIADWRALLEYNPESGQ